MVLEVGGPPLARHYTLPGEKNLEGRKRPTGAPRARDNKHQMDKRGDRFGAMEPRKSDG